MSRASGSRDGRLAHWSLRWIQRSSWLCGLFVGCYTPERTDCQIRCDDSGRCPWDMTYSSGLCATASKACPPETGPAPAPARKESRCISGTRRCASTNRIERCDEDGSWLPEAGCEGGSVCVAGDCRVCAEGMQRCSDSGHVRRCVATGGPNPRRVRRIACAVSRRALPRVRSAPAPRMPARWIATEPSIAGATAGTRRSGSATSITAVIPRITPGRLVLGPALAVVAGGSHTCAVLADRASGVGATTLVVNWVLVTPERRGDTPGEIESLEPVELGAREEVAGVALGLRHTCALLSRGAVKCWGDNSAGQLGLGDNEARGDEPGEMRALPDVDLGNAAVSIAAGGRRPVRYSRTGARVAGARTCWRRPKILPSAIERERSARSRY